jgi:glyoxylase-like metal-dependent hydrolase (beta-lactamase superfamily II)
MKISEGFEVLVIPQERGAYHLSLLFTETEALLVDTGNPGQEDALEKALNEAGLSLERITKIVITHHDRDHIGGLRELRRRLPKVKVWAHVDEIPFIDGSVPALKIQDLDPIFDTLPEKKQFFVTQMKKIFPSITAPVDFGLKDGDVLDFDGGIDVIHTPGHTLGHICLYHRKSKTLIAGDAMNIQEGKLIGANPEFTHDLHEAATTLKRLSHYDIQRIVSYHGGVFEDHPDQAILSLTH